MASSRVSGLRLRIATHCAARFGVPFTSVSIASYAVAGAPKESRWYASVVIAGASVPGMAAVGPNNSSALKLLAARLALDAAAAAE